MVTAIQSAHKRELDACWGNPADNGLTGVLDTEKRSSTACQFERALREKVVGQEQAVQALVDLYQMFCAGLQSPSRPIGNLLFLGPTGSGKTRMVEAAAEILFGDSRAIIKVDCAEFQHSHEIAKLIGSPPGDIGHRESLPRLCQETLDKHHTESVKISVVLFDEIEKASDALWHLLLGILDQGTLTLGDNRRVDFSRSLIFMTSNLGAMEMNAMLSPRLGFAPAADAHNNEKLEERIVSSGVEAARRRFTPEFINRLDKIVVFRPLGDGELEKILALEFNAVRRRLLQSTPNCVLELRVSDAGK